MLIYSRVTPFGFIDPANATDEDRFYGEEVELADADEEAILATAENLRTLFATSGSIQTTGGSSQDQAVEMAAVLEHVANG
jgi:hypothetical protein